VSKTNWSLNPCFSRSSATPGAPRERGTRRPPHTGVTSAYRRALSSASAYRSTPWRRMRRAAPAGRAARRAALRLAPPQGRDRGRRSPGCIVIGSDQAPCGPGNLGKPGTVERCNEQLLKSSGREVEFLTAVHVVDGRALARRATRPHAGALPYAPSLRRWRATSPRTRRSTARAASRRNRSGIALFERIESADPTALPGCLDLALRRASRAGIPVP